MRPRLCSSWRLSTARQSASAPAAEARGARDAVALYTAVQTELPRGCHLECNYDGEKQGEHMVITAIEPTAGIRTIRKALAAHFPDPVPVDVLVLRLGIAAEGHAPTVAGVLGVTAQAVSARLNKEGTRARWASYRKMRSLHELRAAKLRWWWRNRLSNMNIDPHSIDERDPAWGLCWRKPRGWLVREVAAEMRAERAGEPNFQLAANENLIELLRRVDVKTVAMLAHK